MGKDKLIETQEKEYASMRDELLARCVKEKHRNADEETRQRAKREVSGMSLSDNAVFVNLMKSKKLFSHVLSTLLGREMTVVEDRDIEEVRTEYEIALGAHRNVRLDAVARDSNGKLYNIEMENSAYRATAKRARYYASAADVGSVMKGESYENLTDHYHFFLTNGDAIGNGEAINRFTRRNEDGLELNDGSYIFFVNMLSDSDTLLGKLLRSMREHELSKIEDSLVRNAVSLVRKESNMQVSIYDTKVTLGEEREAAISKESFEKGRTEGIEEGIGIGVEKNKVDVVMKAYAKGKFELEDIADIVKLSVDEVKRIIEENKDS